MALVAAAGTLATAAYFDGKFQLKRELSMVLRFKRAEWDYQRRLKDGELSLWYIFAATCARRPNDRAIWTRERNWTFQDLRDASVQYAQWLRDQGIRPGDLVAVYLQNCAKMMIIFFAAMCIGAAPATINYNLEGKALLHCLHVCQSKLLLIDSDEGCKRRIEGLQQDIEGAGTTIITLDPEMQHSIARRPVVVPDDRLRRGMKGDFPAALLYTSGTTGMPKGCPFTLSRLHLMGPTQKPLFDLVPGKDFWYCPMPLYHGTGLMSTALAVLAGMGVAIAPRFSISKFWSDVYESGSTIFIYVGETARYLLAAPPDPLERKHNIRIAYGNGLRPDVWAKFQERFNIPEVVEFFISTEGGFAQAVWARNRYLRGSVGHDGLIMRTLLRNKFVPVLIDHETEDIWRDPNTGFAKRTPYAEGGEIIVAVPNRKAFGGYWNNEDATSKRFAVDVFKKGDLYFRSGDALRRGPDGHWHFLDRLGDTYRWKSETVSTAEVAEVLGRYPGIAEANVFGVIVPGHEGRAGCAALHLENSHGLDYAGLLRHTMAELPRYAVPVFLRIVTSSSHMHNYKQNKVGLRKEGVDPAKIGTEDKEGAKDALLWWKPGTDSYTPFERQHWEALVGGRARL